jgi:hypothetical protein
MAAKLLKKLFAPTHDLIATLNVSLGWESASTFATGPESSLLRGDLV